MMAGKVNLEIVAGPMKGRRFTFEEHDTFLFGRSSECHASLPRDSFASRHHFILEANPPDARVRDLGSLNGTHVNGVPYGGRHASETPEQAGRRQYPQVNLKDGDRIQVGETVFVVSIEGVRAATPLRCSECGKDASGEAGETRGGDYVCEACRAKAKNDPMEILRAMANQAAEGSDDEPVSSIPGYELGKKLGQGGMGTVHLARRKRDGAVVAVKTMLPKVAVDERSRDAFLREADILGGLDHPNIVRLYESGYTGTTFYFVMDYCDDGNVFTLQKRHRGRLPLATVAPMMLQILDGLAYAHDRNFIHRDLKPHNLLITGPPGKKVVKIGDFGLAKNFEKAGYSGMTVTGAYSGTFHFMPREQLINFKYANAVSDVWSIAATFYCMLTGCLPRDQHADQDAMQVVLQEKAVPIRERDSSLPESFADVIDRALSVDTAERYASARLFRDALKAALK